MRLVACITQTSVIDQILTHLRTRTSREAHAGPRRPSDAGPREPGHVTRPTPVRRRSACHLRTAPTPRHHAGTFGVGGRPTGATDWSPPASLPPTVTAVPTALEAREQVGGHAAARQSVLARSAIAPSAPWVVDPP